MDVKTLIENAKKCKNQRNCIVCELRKNCPIDYVYNVIEFAKGKTLVQLIIDIYEEGKR